MGYPSLRRYVIRARKDAALEAAPNRQVLNADYASYEDAKATLDKLASMSRWADVKLYIEPVVVPS
jgi:hypothetical protein